MLHKLQQEFKSGVLENDQNILDMIGVTDGVSSDTRLAIYQNNTFVSLKECLLATYEHVAALVSVEFFRFMADEYIRATPPTKGCLLYYGASFAEFLEGFEPIREHPYLPGLARLEWAIQQSANVEDVASLDASKLLNIEADVLNNTVFSLHPSVQLLSSKYAIFSLWQALNADEPELDGLDIFQQENILMYRSGIVVELIGLTIGRVEFLNAVQSGQKFSECVKAALSAEPKLDLQTMLENFLDAGIFLDFQTK